MLRCMSTTSSLISDFVLSSAPTHLVRESTGRFAIRRQHQNTSASASPSEKLLARIEPQDLFLRLETTCDVVLEPRPGSSAYLTPASSTTLQRSHILGDGDCLYFADSHLKVLYTARQPKMPPLPSPLDESQGSPRAKEDSETDASDDDAPVSPTATTKAPEIVETPVTDRATKGDAEADDAAPASSTVKENPSQDHGSDSEVLAQTPKARVKYGKAASSRRRLKNTISSDAAGPTSSAVATEAAARSVTASVIDEDDGEPIDNKSTTSSGKLSTIKKKRKAPPRPQSAEDTYRVSDEGPPSKKARLPKAAQEETPGEEIAVAQKARQRSSGRTRKTASDNDLPVPAPSLLTDRPPKAVLTMCKLDGEISTWFKKKVTVEEEVPSLRTNYVCVTRDKDLPSTAKILKTLVGGKPVVSIRWILDSHKVKAILDPDDYKHPEVQGNDGKDDRRSLFTGITLFFTNAAVKSYGQGWDAIKEVAKEAGASAVDDGTAAKGNDLTPKHSVLMFGNGDDDAPAGSLIKEHGRTVYDKAMFAQTIIRAKLDLDSDEFKLSGGSGKKVGRKR